MKHLSMTLPLLLITLILCGCAPTRPTSIFSLTQPKDFPNEIARMEEAVQNEIDISLIAKTHLQLALLYSHYKNPNPDYLTALHELELYIALSPNGKSDEIQYFLTLLRALKKTILANQEATAKMEQLMNENRDIKKILEELKHLDIKMEEKRRQIK